MGNRVGAAENEGAGGRDGSLRNGIGRSVVNNRERTVRNLPYAEFVKRREEGRCFRCGGPFGPGHRCPERSLLMTILAEDEEDEEEEEESELDQMQMELSAFSAGGLTQPKTMKLHERIGEKQVLILIDSGASHNFISNDLVKELGLTVEDTPQYLVSLGDGQKKKTRGCCEKVVIHMGEIDITERFHLFELGGVDVILGVEWLAKLGEVTLNWRELTMVFEQGGRKRTIKGDPTLARRVVEPKALFRMKEVEAWMLVWELGWIWRSQEPIGGELTKAQSVAMDQILSQHARVFHESRGLPPDRGMVHQIPLKEGTDPMKYGHTVIPMS